MFVLPRLIIGGVERITLNLIRELVGQGVDCCLALRQAYGAYLNEARELVDVHEVASAGLVTFVPNLARLIKEWRPTHIVSTFSDVTLLTLAARYLSGLGALVVCGVHNSHGRQITPPGLAGTLRYFRERFFARLAYRLCDALVTGSHGLRREVVTQFGVPVTRVQTIYNPVIGLEEWEAANRRKTRKGGSVFRFVAIGRLVHQKAFDVLISAKRLCGSSRDWQVHIFGAGPDRDTLQRQIEEAGLEGEVMLRGETAAPLEELLNADAFVLPSRFEGLPTVLVLAAAVGLPIVATDCPHGPSEVLDAGRLGRLVAPENASALAAAIEDVLEGRFDCDKPKLRLQALQFVTRESALRWLRLLNEVHEGARSA